MSKGTDAAQCDACDDNPKKKCKECGCWVCAKKSDPEKTLMCDECNMPYHIFCLKPPLSEVPDVDEWYVQLAISVYTNSFFPSQYHLTGGPRRS